jgi:hypothetical protein
MKQEGPGYITRLVYPVSRSPRIKALPIETNLDISRSFVVTESSQRQGNGLGEKGAPPQQPYQRWISYLATTQVECIQSATRKHN